MDIGYISEFKINLKKNEIMTQKYAKQVQIDNVTKCENISNGTL